MSERSDAEFHLSSLISMFYSMPTELAEFAWQSAEQCPSVYRQLLDHSSHMTVTVERHYGQPVDVQVLDAVKTGHDYRRKILLRSSQDNQVVQFGIVSLDLDCLPPTARDLVLARAAPLGRILIENQVLSEVQLCSLWSVRCGPELARLFEVPVGTLTYGRTARILLHGKSAIELLEIVTTQVY